jgi:hypothetical protein
MTRADTMRAETMRADAMRADTMRAETMAVEVLATDATGLPFAVDFLVDLLEALLPIRDFFVTAIVDSPRK